MTMEEREALMQLTLVEPAEPAPKQTIKLNDQMAATQRHQC